MMELLDRKRVTILCGIDISFLSEEEQDWVFEAITIDRMTVNQEKTKKLKAYSESGQLTRDMVRITLAERKTKHRKFAIREQVIAEFFDEDATNEDIEEVICSLLRRWKNGDI